MAAGFTASLSLAGSINDIQSGRHKGYSLLVVTADIDVTYSISEQGAYVVVSFPRGTGIEVPGARLSELKDDFFRGISFDAASGRLTIEVARNYKLRTYENRRPFQLVMDFTHLAGRPQKPVSEPVVRQEKVQQPKPKVVEPVQKESPDVNSITDPFKKGMAFAEIGDFANALKAFEAAVPRSRDEAKYQMALMYEELNQREKAIEILLQVVNTSPNWIEPRLKLGMLYKLSGRDGMAEKLWTQILEVLEADTNYNFTELQPQIEYLEQLLNAEDEDLEDSIPLLNKIALPNLPWKWIFIVLGIGGAVIAVRLITNWRMNKLLGSVYDESEEFEEDLSLEGIDMDNLGDLHEPAPKAEEVTDDDLSDFIESADSDDIPPELGDSEEMTDEKQQMIYDLLDQKYSIAEIAKMLDMGQEEVKFIIDFRSTSDE